MCIPQKCKSHLAIDRIIAGKNRESVFWTMVYVCCLEAKFKCVAVKQYARHALVDRNDDARQRTFICSHFDHSAPGLLLFVVVVVVVVVACCLLLL